MQGSSAHIPRQGPRDRFGESYPSSLPKYGTKVAAAVTIKVRESCNIVTIYTVINYIYAYRENTNTVGDTRRQAAELFERAMSSDR